MKRVLLLLLVGIINFTLSSCEKDSDSDQYYVTYTVEGTYKSLSIWRSGYATFYVNGIAVQLPYKETIGPVEKGYACSLMATMVATNAQASFSSKIAVNGKTVKSGGKSLYASGYNKQKASEHLEYIIK